MKIQVEFPAAAELRIAIGQVRRMVGKLNPNADTVTVERALALITEGLIDLASESMRVK